MPTIRQPAVAGQFYPGEAGELRQMLVSFVGSAVTANTPKTGTPKMLIVPHAGYIYSGTVAGSAYAYLQQPNQIRRVVLLGPSHRVALRGMAVPSVDAFVTPMGAVRIDAALRDSIVSLPGVMIHDAPHTQEHALEVQLPFLQTTLGDSFSLLPIVVGDAAPETVAAVLEALWGGEETLIVISTDLSHYLPYELSQRVDKETSSMIESLQADIVPEQACGAYPLNGALLVARRHGLHVTCVGLANSGDTAGSRDRVVGYGAYVVA